MSGPAIMPDAEQAAYFCRELEAERRRHEATRAEVEALRRGGECLMDDAAAAMARALAAEARIGVLEGALDGVWCAMSSKGEKCWCAYERIIHPQDDPQDALTLEPNGHTKECNTARSALGGGEGEK